MGTQEGTGDGDGEAGDRQLLTSSSSAAAFVEGGIQDACDDSCSICLEPFCHSNPATVTSCKHEYHVQCILEWAQRSKECPMCWQSLSLKDPSSQELLDAVEQEQAWRRFEDGTQLHQAPSFGTYDDFEERIMQHLAHQLARRGMLRNSRVPEAHMEESAEEAQSPSVRRVVEAITHNGLSTRTQSEGAQILETNLEPVQEGQQRSLSLDVTESLKSRFLVASAKCKETFSRTTRSLKERWRGRSSKAADLRARAQEGSADVVRQALRRITPASDGNEDGKEDVATTSTGHESVAKSGEASRCTANGHGGGVAMTEALREQPSEVV